MLFTQLPTFNLKSQNKMIPIKNLQLLESVYTKFESTKYLSVKSMATQKLKVNAKNQKSQSFQRFTTLRNAVKNVYRRGIFA